ncbi:MAG TPA: PepSY domain-containing protein [Pyrinomonadaceae bacterium]|jgi:uncharacterized membrane protein YkoI|nr:PepSY domain-containing protein [Pyrinomonadaceae bacterium]
MRKLTGKMKLMMAVALLAVLTTGAGVALKAMAQGEGRKQEDKVTYRSSVQTQDDRNEREDADEAQGGEESEANEAGESEDGEKGEEAEDRAEGAESERLKSLARITPEQARDAALAQVPGTVKKVELENEDGNVVYGVEIKTAKGESDVKVDAGDGRVLHVEHDGEGD